MRVGGERTPSKIFHTIVANSANYGLMAAA